MFKFKVKYADKDGNPVGIEVSVGMSSITSGAAGDQLGILYS